jgi:hypothetical protein
LWHINKLIKQHDHYTGVPCAGDNLNFKCFILPLFIQVFLIEITSLFQERPGPIAAGGTTLQTKQRTYTNTTLNKTINTHTVQQEHFMLKRQVLTIKGHSKMCSFVTQHNPTDVVCDKVEGGAVVLGGCGGALLVTLSVIYLEFKAHLTSMATTSFCSDTTSHLVCA